MATEDIVFEPFCSKIEYRFRPFWYEMEYVFPTDLKECIDFAFDTSDLLIGRGHIKCPIFFIISKTCIMRTLTMRIGGQGRYRGGKSAGGWRSGGGRWVTQGGRGARAGRNRKTFHKIAQYFAMGGGWEPLWKCREAGGHGAESSCRHFER